MKNEVSKNINGINVCVDKRTELLGIIMWLSNYNKKFSNVFEKTENEFYIDNIFHKFLEYKDEKCIKDFEKLYNAHLCFGYDSPINLFLQLDDNYECSELNNYVFNEILDGDNFVYEFIAEIKEFASKIDFENYYNDNINLYEQWVNNTSNQFNNFDLKDYINKYFGYDNQKELYVNLLPYASKCGYNVTLDNRIYSNCPIQKGLTKETLFSNDNITLHLHEFSHGYVDALTDRFKLVDENTSLFFDVKEESSKYGYPTDKEILNEHIITGIQCRFILNSCKNIEEYNEYVSNASKYFKYLDPVLDSLEQYENNRNIYRTFDEFYPIIIENITEYKKSKNK